MRMLPVERLTDEQRVAYAQVIEAGDTFLAANAPGAPMWAFISTNVQRARDALAGDTTGGN